MFGSAQRIAEVEKRIAILQEQRQRQQADARATAEYGQRNAQQVEQFFRWAFADHRKKAELQLAALPPQTVCSWQDPRWSQWNLNQTGAEPVIRIGELADPRSTDFAIPAYVPFIGGKRTIIIRTNGTTADRGISLLQSLVARTSAMLPHQSAYTLLDPAAMGIHFPMRRNLRRVRDPSNDVRRDLGTVIEDIQRIIAQYLHSTADSFERVPEELREGEPFQFVFAADFPNQFDRGAIEALQSIANNGVAAGVYLFIHYNTDHVLPRDMSMDSFKNAHYLDVALPGSVSVQGLTLTYDTVPSASVQDQLFAKIAKAEPTDRPISWEDVVALPESQWWQGNATYTIESPVGLRGTRDPLRLWFGEKPSEQPCIHGILGAAAGMGKSNLFHTLICGLAIRYSPQELQVYIVDGKEGVELRPYSDLPHARVVSLNTTPDLARSILAELVAEKERRNTLFGHAHVAGFIEYRSAGQPLGNLPRIMLLVDEYQEFFEGDEDGSASAMLLQLAQQGRSAGIHMLLASQRFGVRQMIDQTGIFENMYLRAAMGMPRDHVTSLQEFGPRGRALMEKWCDRPGKAVINDKGGDDSANVTGKVALLLPASRDRVLRDLKQRAAGRPPDQLARTVLFDGQAQPTLLENPQFVRVAAVLTPLTSTELEAVARASEEAGGFGIADWFAAEHPRIGWLGQKFNVHGHANVVFRRRASENLVIVGSNSAARYGMLAAFLAALALNGAADETQFVIADRSVLGAQWSDILHQAVDTVIRPSGCPVYFTRNADELPQMLDDLLAALEQRKSFREEQVAALPSVFVVLTELDRSQDFRRVADGWAKSPSPLGAKLRQLLSDGPWLGIHTILSFAGVRTSLAEVLDDRRDLETCFRHRVALQMSEEESFTFVRSHAAAQLQTLGARPVCALYMDTENDTTARFKPYSTDPGDLAPEQSLVAHLQLVGQRLAVRSRVS